MPIVWNRPPTDDVLDRYFQDILPILDRRLGAAGLRRAKFLNDAYGSDQCPAR
jgi:hypothetical protein